MFFICVIITVLRQRFLRLFRPIVINRQIVKTQTKYQMCGPQRTEGSRVVSLVIRTFIVIFLEISNLSDSDAFKYILVVF